jgi:hypothetical protein
VVVSETSVVEDSAVVPEISVVSLIVVSGVSASALTLKLDTIGVAKMATESPAATMFLKILIGIKPPCK